MIAGTSTTKEHSQKQTAQFNVSPEDDLIDLDGGVTASGFTAEFDPETQQQPELHIEKMDSTNSSTGASKTSFTTANGDGLTFDPFSLNIFDEIQLIIDGREKEHEQAVKDFEAKQDEVEEPEPVAAEEEEYFEIDDIPEHLKPTSIILEIIEQLEELKENLIPLRERDEQLTNCIRQLSRGHF